MTVSLTARFICALFAFYVRFVSLHFISPRAPRSCYKKIYAHVQGSEQRKKGLRCRQRTSTNTFEADTTHCKTLHQTTAHCSTLYHTGRNKDLRCRQGMTAPFKVHTAHCSTLQHTAARCSTPQHTTAHGSTLQHTTTHRKKERHQVQIGNNRHSKPM